MINSINISMVRQLCDKAGIANSIDDDGDIRILLSADSDFGHNVAVYINVSKDNKWLRTFAIAGFEVPQERLAEVMIRMNDYNRKGDLLKAYLTEKGRVIVERYELIDEYVSEEFILENCIKLFPGKAWTFYKENFSDF